MSNNHIIQNEKKICNIVYGIEGKFVTIAHRSKHLLLRSYESGLEVIRVKNDDIIRTGQMLYENDLEVIRGL